MWRAAIKSARRPQVKCPGARARALDRDLDEMARVFRFAALRRLRHVVLPLDELLAQMRLEHVRHAYPQRLSLGMQRRVAPARAFAVEPDLLLMDEPFVSLDEPTAHRLRMLLLEIWRRKPTTVLLVTHDLREAIQLGERLVVLSATPARVRADIVVELDAPARAQPEAVERRRIRLVAADPELAGCLS